MLWLYPTSIALCQASLTQVYVIKDAVTQHVTSQIQALLHTQSDPQPVLPHMVTNTFK